MKAVLVHELSNDLSTLKLEDIPTPEPGNMEVRVKLKATAINFPDVLMVEGGYQFKPPMPFSPGGEGAGEISAIGPGVKGWAVGDPVIVGLRAGGLMEEVIVPSGGLRRKPDALTFEEAAGLTTIYLTAYVALVRRGELQAGETLLVHGAAGGVGIAAVNLGKALGAKVIACASTEEKRQLCLDYGADHVIDYTKGFKDEVKALTDGKGADVIYDPVGGDVFDESVRCINWGGRLLIIGFTSGRIPTVPVNMPLIKGFSVVGVRAGEYGRRDPKGGAENIAAIMRLAEEGKIKPPIGHRFPLAQAKEALATLKDRKALGKVVVTFD